MQLTSARRVAVAVSLALLVAACGSTDSSAEDEQDEPATRSVETAYGAVDVPVAPKRIVAVSYNTPWQLEALGISPAGVFDYSAWADQFSPEQLTFIEDIPTVGADATPDPEAIAALDPDLIVGEAYEVDEALYRTLSKIAPTAIVGGTDRGDWKAISRGLAEVTGTTAELDDVVAAYEKALARIRATYADELALEWAYVSLGVDAATFAILYPNGVMGAMLHTELGAPMAPGVPPGAPDPGFETVSIENADRLLGGADVLVQPVDAEHEPLPQLAALFDQPVMARLPAIAAGHLYGVFTLVIDHASARAWLEELEERVLRPLAGSS